MTIRSKCVVAKRFRDKVKVTLRCGRDGGSGSGAEVLSWVRTETEDFAKVEAMPKLEGRQMIMVLAPSDNRRDATRRFSEALILSRSLYIKRVSLDVNAASAWKTGHAWPVVSPCHDSIMCKRHFR